MDSYKQVYKALTDPVTSLKRANESFRSYLNRGLDGPSYLAQYLSQLKYLPQLIDLMIESNNYLPERDHGLHIGEKSIFMYHFNYTMRFLVREHNLLLLYHNLMAAYYRVLTSA